MRVTSHEPSSSGTKPSLRPMPMAAPAARNLGVADAPFLQGFSPADAAGAGWRWFTRAGHRVARSIAVADPICNWGFRAVSFSAAVSVALKRKHRPHRDTDQSTLLIFSDTYTRGTE